jgi:NAD(P)-dependent dehydrogenase (short-subunit alcohol dehydrogenase family)
MKTALVTGANKGIGLETVKQLLERNFIVFLGIRDNVKGKKTLEKLSNYKERVHLLRLDISDEKDIILAADKFRELTLNLDVIINNAAILIDENEKIDKVESEKILHTFKTNTLGPILVVKYFSKYLNDSARIINVSSGYGSISEMGDFPPAYAISKAALNAVTRLQSSALKSKNIIVNSVSPGWVKTDMGGSNAPRSIEKGAESIVWLAAEAPNNINNMFISDKESTNW